MISRLLILYASPPGGASAETTAPTVSSATIAANGTTFTVVFSEPVVGHTGFAVTLSGGAASLTYVSGEGTNALVYTLGRTVASTETGTLAYTAGDVADLSSNALANFSGTSVTNNSTQTGGSFSPDDIAGLILWLEADGTLWQDSARTTPATSDGDRVGAWDDASSHANHLTQATSGLRGTLKTNVVNGEPVVRLDGATGQYLRTGTGTFGDHVTIVAVAYLASVTGAASNYQRLVHLHAAGDNYGFFGAGQHTGTFATFFGNGSTWNDIAFNSPETDIRSAWHLLAVTNDDTTATPYLDGSAMTTKTGSMNAATGLALGAEPGGPQQFWDGDVAALLIYDSALSAGDLSGVFDYLTTKYGL